jgi:hypothetical protein
VSAAKITLRHAVDLTRAPRVALHINEGVALTLTKGVQCHNVESESLRICVAMRPRGEPRAKINISNYLSD